MSGASTISFIVPAGGRSARMGTQNKLLLPLGRRTVLEHVVLAALGSNPLEVILVTGADGERVASVMTAPAIRIIHNPEYEEGMASSLRVGVGNSSTAAAGFAVLPGDLPFVRSTTIDHVCARLRPKRIVVPLFEGRHGHPVVFAASYREDLMRLGGDVGARSVIKSHPSAVYLLETDDPGIVLDVDTMAEYRRARQA